MEKIKKKVVVGMSGGVDSSVTALLLKEQGYEVIGLYMKNWEETDPNATCPSEKDIQDVALVCAQLNIPYYAVNFTQEYKDLVFNDFLQKLKAGRTPNPDILCNREIKFHALLNKAIDIGADYLATGHYACTDEKGRLFKGIDPNKDQSYFLYTLDQDVLQKVLFPIGHLLKTNVRSIAQTNNLATSNKKDSTGICFIGEKNFRSFINQYIPYQKGAFATLNGNIVGEHLGIAFYTIGQRKGLGIGGSGEAWFVVGKDIDRNIVFVEQGENNKALYASSLIAKEAHWIEKKPPSLPLRCSAKIRYRQSDQRCTIIEEKNGEWIIEFDEPQRAITPSQSIVFYLENQCLGGAVIEKAF